MGGIFALILLGTLGLLLVSAGIQDARTREIANWKNLAIAVLAPAWWLANGVPLWPDAAIQVGVAFAVFLIFAGAFYLNMMGAGDVKMIGALALWLPFDPLLQMLMVMSLVGGAVTILIAVEHRMRRQPAAPEIPYGVAIAIAGLLALREPIFNGIA